MDEMKGVILDSELIGTISCDLWDAYRKFANPHIALIAGTIYGKGPLTLGELRTLTGIQTNLLNRNLIEMRRVAIIKKLGKRYCLTTYGGILTESIGKIKSELASADETELFRPIVDKENPIEA